jgi:hypothetical protein
MTVCEQLAEQMAARLRATTYYGAAEITLVTRLPSLPSRAMRNAWNHVNAAEIGGAAAGHLRVSRFDCRPEVRDGVASYRLAVRLLYCAEPWNRYASYPEIDLDALLDALEAGAEVERPETWRTRRGML